MRETPSHIAEALEAYDPRLSIKWDTRLNCWMFHSGKESLFAYRHENNLVAMEPVLDEIMKIVRRTDHRASRDFWTREISKARRRRLESERKESEDIRQRCSEHAGDYAEFWRKGPTPMISPLLSHAT